MTERDEAYVDVFISHKKEDLAIARRLHTRVKSLRYEPYLDAADTQLAEATSTGALADRIRGRLRRAKCLLFVVTPKAVDSKWMPWELGFFDGRWGRPTVGLYVQHMDRTAAQRAGAAGRFTVQEYLELYEAVDDATLPDFLRRATSGEMLANRRDVDVDRLLTLLTSAGRNPLAFQLGWAQYLLGMLQPLAAAVPPWQALLDAQIQQLAQWRAAAESAAPAADGGAGGAPDLLEGWTRWWREAHGGGVRASEAPGAAAGPGAAPLLQPGFGEAMAAAQRSFEDAMKKLGPPPK